ncbi:hypothetical protein N9273_00415 [bacterium]|nr:hypothetical protein [bacterium]
MHNKEILDIAQEIKELYNIISTPSEKLHPDVYIKKIEKYDDLVDKIVELTNGNASALFTDPVLCDDYTALTGEVTNDFTYNKLCEYYGSVTFGE